MSVHYKFMNNLDHDTVTFDGLSISVADLKKSIMHQKKIRKSSDFDLQITNAQTKEVYEKNETLIPINTSVFVSCVPVQGGSKNKIGKAYKEVKKEKPPFVPQDEPVVEPEPQLPVKLLCMVCNDLLVDAVLIPCCGKSFCDKCICQILESDNHECPVCHENKVSPNYLIPNNFKRTAVANFKNERGKPDKSPKTTGAKCSETIEAPVAAATKGKSGEEDIQKRSSEPQEKLKKVKKVPNKKRQRSIASSFHRSTKRVYQVKANRSRGPLRRQKKSKNPAAYGLNNKKELKRLYDTFFGEILSEKELSIVEIDEWEKRSPHDLPTALAITANLVYAITKDKLCNESQNDRSIYAAYHMAIVRGKYLKILLLCAINYAIGFPSHLSQKCKRRLKMP